MEQKFQLASKGRFPKRGRKVALGRLIATCVLKPNKTYNLVRLNHINKAEDSEDIQILLVPEIEMLWLKFVLFLVYKNPKDSSFSSSFQSNNER